MLIEKSLAVLVVPVAWVLTRIGDEAALFTEFKDTAPSLAALVSVVWILVRYLDRRDRLFSVTIERMDQRFREIQETMKDTNKTLGQVAERLRDK